MSAQRAIRLRYRSLTMDRGSRRHLSLVLVCRMFPTESAFLYADEAKFRIGNREDGSGVVASMTMPLQLQDENEFDSNQSLVKPGGVEDRATKRALH